VDFNAGEIVEGSVLNHTYQVLQGSPPLTWSNLISTGPSGALPNLSPMLDANGAFSWDTTGSALGLWTFDATVAVPNFLAADVARLTVELKLADPPPDGGIPEPSTLLLFAIATFANSAGRRRKWVV
jgi:hypothetical protein